MTDVKETSAAAYKRGKAEGYDEGHKVGHYKGYEEGYEEGNDFGQDKGHDEGHDMGTSEGHAIGYEDAREEMTSPQSVDDTAEELVKLLRDNPTINGSSNYLELKTLLVGFLRDRLPPHYRYYHPEI